MTRSLTARTRLLAASAALLLTVGALAGCSDRPGQAADMQYTGLDGASHSIVVTEKDIDVVAKEMEPESGQTNQVTGQKRQAPARIEIASLLIEAPLLVEVGQAHGMTVTDAQIVQLAKEQLGFEPRQATTIAYLRARLLVNQFEELGQQPELSQTIFADLNKLHGTLHGDRSPRYPDTRPAWWTQEDPRPSLTNNPTGGNQQQVPQQGGQQQPQQQQAPQQGGQQTVPQEGAEQPADSGRTEGQTENEPANGGAGEGGQDAGQAEGNGQ